MAMLEGFSKVAVIKYGQLPYHFAIYDDGNDYQVGEMVMLSGISNPGRIDEIISVEEAQNRFKKDITAEVIGKIDMTAYDKRVFQRKERERLKKGMEKRKKEVQAMLEDDFFASKDGAYAELLKQYRNL